MILKIKKRHFYFAIAAIILFLAISIASARLNKSLISIDNSGFLAINAKKPIDYRLFPYEEKEDYTIKKAAYASFGKEIYGFLVLPKQSGKLPGIVLLPGAGVDKKSELSLAIKLAHEGYAVLTIDQRGIGETGGDAPSLEEDMSAYLNGNYAAQHFMVADALAAINILKKQDAVNPNKIIVMGESLGGRVALMAAAIDKGISGAIAISTAGFHYSGGNDDKSRFIKSIDPDNYIFGISPRKVFMLHNSYDKNVPFESALITFKKAKEPKEFILVNDTMCNHGFCDSMFHDINLSLASMIG